MQNTMCDNIVSSNSQELSNASASSALKLFENPQFRVRVIMRCAEPWFVAKDACTCLEIANVSDACSRLDEDERGIVSTDTPSGKQEMLIISEPGLYSLIGSSKKPEARAFKRWVNHEVLPSIRKTGSYSIGQTQSVMLPNFCDPAEAARAWADLYEKNQAAEKRALTAEAELTSEKEAHEKDNEDFKAGFDILNSQKAQIGSTREATAMATASTAKAHQRLAEKVLETNASELMTLRAVVDEQRSRLWDANQTAHEIYKLKVLKKEYSLNTLQNKARLLLSHFATKLDKRPIPLPNGATYTDSFGRLQTSKSTYYERDVVNAVLNWVVENPNKFARVGGKQDPLLDEW